MKLTKYSSNFSKKQIILLSIPVFFSNLAIPLVGMVDTGLMGNLGETKYLSCHKYSHFCNDNDYMELWFFKNGNGWYRLSSLRQEGITEKSLKHY